MVDDAPAGDLVIDQAFANKLNENDGRVLSLSRLRSSPDVIEKLRDEHLIDIIDTYFKADEMISIDFSDCVGITDAALKYISTKCTRLERLRVGGCEKITDDGIKAIVEKIGKKLKILSYSNCNRCTDSALQAIVQNCPNLSTLAAENAGITQIPEAIGKNLPQLGDLYLENNDIKTISPAVLSSILALLRKGGLLMISGNPLQDVPTEVLEGGNSAILKHLKTLPIQKEGLTHEHPVGGIDDSPNFDLTHEHTVGGINDSPNFDPDRLGTSVFAEAISEVVQTVESPDNSMCIALFGRWGDGKTFMYKLIHQWKQAKANQLNQDRLKELEEERQDCEHSNIFFKTSERSLQFLCNFIALICCSCHHESESIATLVAFPLFWPVWICLYLVLYPSILIVFCYIKLVESIEFRINRTRRRAKWKSKLLYVATLPITLPYHAVFGDESAVNRWINKKCQDWTNLPRWRDVRDILTGNVSLHPEHNLYESRSSCSAMFQLVILSAMQPIFKFIQSRWNLQLIFWGYQPFKKKPGMKKNIEVKCSAWLYNGTDLLWAALMEEMWSKVEEEYGPYRVRRHRFSISISTELKSDPPKVKQSKRKAAMLMLKIKLFCYLALAALLTIFYSDIVVFSKKFLPAQVYLVLPASLYTLPAYPLLKNPILLVFQLLGKSKGAVILLQAQSLEKHKRTDFSGKTGFMGEVKTEVEFLYDFLKTEPIIDWVHQVLREPHVQIMLDDMDRCGSKTIMDILQAVMMLLLEDAPITCWLLIDGRVVVSSIEEQLGDKLVQEGVDGYRFLDKLVQLPFCIPDLDIHRKENYFEKIFEKDELSPRRLYERLQFLDEKTDLKEFKGLLLSKRSLTEDEGVLIQHDLKPVFEIMVEMPDILNHNEDIETCFDSPKIVLEKLNKRLDSKQALDARLEEEFLYFVSVGIEELLARSSLRLEKEKSSPAQEASEDIEASTPSTPSIPNSDDNDGFEIPPGVQDSGVDILAPAGEKEATISDSPSPETTDDVVSSYNKVYHPIMNLSERAWFKKYAKYFNGQPRKMKRIMNSYMVSRIVAEKLKPNLADQNDFGEKLLKLVMLFEQWPYRMAWFLVIVQNIQQEKSMKVRPNVVVGQQESDDKTVDAEFLTSQNPIVETSTSIISRLSKSEGKNIMDLPLLNVYHQLIQTLIYSPETAPIQLQGDGDPQIFENLLAEPEAPLMLADIASSSGSQDSTSQSTIRPYLFNLQGHMIDKVQNYLDNCMIHSVENKSKKVMYGVYQKKPDFFNQKYPTPSPVDVMGGEAAKINMQANEANKLDASNSELYYHLRGVELAQADADRALRERKMAWDELSALAGGIAAEMRILPEWNEFVKAKNRFDEADVSLQDAKVALEAFRSGMNAQI